MTTLVAESISKSFRDRHVITSATLSASSGQVVGLLGRVGSGKSTLLKICAGITRPDSGWVALNGIKSQRPGRASLARRGLFYLGEKDNLAWSLSVRQHFDEIERRFGSGPDSEWRDSLEIVPLLDRRANQLSGGETKRVEMALAITRNPDCLLADEVLRSADPILCELLGKSMRMLAARGCAVVVSGHEVNFLMPFLDSITWVTSGTTYDVGPRESALENDKFVREYLGRPNFSI